MLEHGSWSTGWRGCRTVRPGAGRGACCRRRRSASTSRFWEFFWPLLAGARLVMARPGGHRDPRLPGRDDPRARGSPRCTSSRRCCSSSWSTRRRRAARGCVRVPVQRRGAPGRAGAAVPRAAPGRGAVQPVRADRGGGEVTEWECAAGRRERVSDRPADRTTRAVYVLDRARRAGARRRGGRAVHRRRGGGARLPGPAGADGGALRPRSVRRSRARGCTAPATWCGGARGRSTHRVPGRAPTSR